MTFESHESTSASYRPVGLSPASFPDPEDGSKLAVRVTADRILCKAPEEGDRRTRGGILIPPTAKGADRRGLWAEVTEVGPLVRGVEAGDKVLFLPDSVIEVDVRGDVFLIVRERDVHAVASQERTAGSTGLYL
ncbi:MAG: GroES family chaperonin [Egibacteraceae bacterium]